jgi:hypothetical protein
MVSRYLSSTKREHEMPFHLPVNLRHENLKMGEGGRTSFSKDFRVQSRSNAILCSNIINRIPCKDKRINSLNRWQWPRNNLVLSRRRFSVELLHLDSRRAENIVNFLDDDLAEGACPEGQ